jgi:pyruvate/2-oxoglutarate dehydrogenase complex dihydrolipoamide acyltransferase (E2) component
VVAAGAVLGKIAGADGKDVEIRATGHGTLLRVVAMEGAEVGVGQLLMVMRGGGDS